MNVRIRFCATVVAALVGAGCGSNQEDFQTVPPHLIESMKTHCAGRFLIDLPASFRLTHSGTVGVGDATFYFGHGTDFSTVDVSVVADRITPGIFEAGVAQRMEELTRATNHATDGPMLVGSETWGDTGIRLLRYASSVISDAKVHELHLLVGEAHVAMSTTAFQESQARDADARLQAMATRVAPVGDPQNAPPGTCLGPVVVDAGSDYEELELAFRATDAVHADIRFRISLNTLPQADDEPSLIARGESNLTGLGVKWKTLNKGERPLAGMRGEQWLGAFEDRGASQHGFYAETDLRTAAPGQPRLMLEMFTGGERDSGEPVAASLSDGQAVSLWTLILDSLRFRR